MYYRILSEVFILLFSTCSVVATASPAPRSKLPSGTPIRLLPLGDSITWGTNLAGTGYRGQLYDDLAGNDVDFIGVLTQIHGLMPDPDNAGWPGYTIDQIRRAANKSCIYDLQPNIVCLHAGTNDLNNEYATQPYESAPERLEALINDITLSVPQTLVLVAKIIQSAHPDVNARNAVFNAQIDQVVLNAQQEGTYKVRSVDMSGISDLIFDGTHPTDRSYRAMGDIWYNAIWNADTQGFISPAPEPTKDETGSLPLSV